MRKKGGVVAIQGVADNPSTKQRFAGLKRGWLNVQE
jgi:hypothetical protein